MEMTGNYLKILEKLSKNWYDMLKTVLFIG